MAEGYPLKPLPLPQNLETVRVLKQLNEATRHLAELKWIAATIPNEQILINTLTLQEAQQSSEIENIITTQDELYKGELGVLTSESAEVKEVRRYATALRTGYQLVQQQGMITSRLIQNIQATLVQNDAGYRKLPGTALLNAVTKETVYVPPQHPETVAQLMDNLVQYINDDSMEEADPLVKMAIIHHQFESIHPFYDGNGRTGRILNILYLVLKGRLNLPILYLSRYIMASKQHYYHHLQAARDQQNWEDYVLYMLKGIAITAQETGLLVQHMRNQMQEVKSRMRSQLPRVYSQEMLNNIFVHPYTKIEFVEHDLGVSRLTATRYLDALVKHGFLQKHKLGRSNYYLNAALGTLLASPPRLPTGL